MSHLAVWASLAAGNFLCACFSLCNWETAAERSFFQALAVGLVWALLERKNKCS